MIFFYESMKSSCYQVVYRQSPIQLLPQLERWSGSFSIAIYCTIVIKYEAKCTLSILNMCSSQFTFVRVINMSLNKSKVKYF